jgi:hypothetical protein
MWTARRILKELASTEKRRAVLAAFWRHAELSSKLTAQVHLARALNFREESIRKMAPEKKADLLASRIGSPEFDDVLEMALMHYHTSEKPVMMGAFLDHWNVPHQNGSIDAEEYARPTAEQVRAAARALESEYGREDVLLYLASAGLLMDEGWRDATWPVVDEMA